jgi:hypothetical protein
LIFPSPLQIHTVLALSVSTSSSSHRQGDGKKELHPTLTNFFNFFAIMTLASCSLFGGVFMGASISADCTKFGSIELFLGFFMVKMRSEMRFLG